MAFHQLLQLIHKLVVIQQKLPTTHQISITRKILKSIQPFTIAHKINNITYQQSSNMLMMGHQAVWVENRLVEILTLDNNRISWHRMQINKSHTKFLLIEKIRMITLPPIINKGHSTTLHRIQSRDHTKILPLHLIREARKFLGILRTLSLRSMRIL